MKKLFTALLFLLVASYAKAQNLTNRIPKDVFAVANVKGAHLFSLMPVAEFDHSYIGQKFIQQLSQNKDKNYQSIADLGINLDQTSYYFSVLTDSINYNCFLLPLANASAFATFVNTETDFIKDHTKTNTVLLKDSSGIITWDAEKALYISGKVNDTFLDRPENAERYGIAKLIMPYENNYPPVVEDESMVADTATDIKIEGETEFIDSVPPPAISNENNLTEYYKRYHANDSIKKVLQLAWLTKKADYVLNGSFEPISGNASYLKSVNDKAVASVWVSDLQSVYKNMLSGLTMYKNLNAFGGFGQLNLNLFLEGKKMRVESKMTLDDSMADSYRKMMDQKINRKFFKYVDSEKAIGFASYAVNTEAYLHEFPKLLTRTYGGLLGEDYADIADLGGDLFSLILDEEAIAEVIKGDILFVINGITAKEVKYTSYEYDDDYQRQEVEKTKTETLPSFLLMFSSDDYKMLTKLLNLNAAKNYVSQKDGFYTVSYRKSPFDFHVMMKDGMVFIGNNLEDFNQIRQNAFQATISKSHKKMLKKSNFSMVVNPKILANKVPFTELAGETDGELFKNTLADMQDIHIKSNRIKGNVISGEMVAEISSGQKNVLQYVFSLIEKAADL